MGSNHLSQEISRDQMKTIKQWIAETGSRLTIWKYNRDSSIPAARSSYTLSWTKPSSILISDFVHLTTIDSSQWRPSVQRTPYFIVRPLHQHSPYRVGRNSAWKLQTVWSLSNAQNKNEKSSSRTIIELKSNVFYHVLVFRSKLPVIRNLRALQQ